MHRSYPNLVPVASKYLAQKQFEKDEATYKTNLKHAHGLLDQSAPSPRPHCYDRTRQKQIKEYELAVIEHENERLRSRMSTNGSYINSHNDYVIHSLNVEKRHRDESQHKNEVKRLQKQIHQTHTYYPTREYQDDFAKQLDIKKRITRYPSNNK